MNELLESLVQLINCGVHEQRERASFADDDFVLTEVRIVAAVVGELKRDPNLDEALLFHLRYAKEIKPNTRTRGCRKLNRPN